MRPIFSFNFMQNLHSVHMFMFLDIVHYFCKVLPCIDYRILWFQVIETQLKLTQAGKGNVETQETKTQQGQLLPLSFSLAHLPVLIPSCSFKSQQPWGHSDWVKGLLRFPKWKTLYKDVDWPGLRTRWGLWLVQFWGGCQPLNQSITDTGEAGTLETHHRFSI